MYLFLLLNNNQFMNIPISKPYLDSKEIKAVSSVLKSGWIVQGSKVAEFESLIAAYTGAKFAKASSSCTTALHLALLTSGIQKSDHVLVPSFTYISTANAVEYIGAKPVFIDIDPNTFNINPSKIIDYLGKKKSQKGL